jgi:PAS domain-containing protein
VCLVAETDRGKGKGKPTADQLFPKALDGFVFILSREGDIVYVNESVNKYLGIQQVGNENKEQIFFLNLHQRCSMLAVFEVHLCMYCI